MKRRDRRGRRDPAEKMGGFALDDVKYLELMHGDSRGS
jgi:hypothetical protein